MDYRFELADFALIQDEIKLCVKVNCKYNEKVLSPKVRLLLRKNGKSRRLSLPITSYTNKNGQAEILAAYDYKLPYLFLDNTVGDIELTFAFVYGEKEYEGTQIIADINNEYIKLTENCIIISKDYTYTVSKNNEIVGSLAERIRKSAKLFFTKTANIYYRKLCKKDIVKNRISFISGRRKELGGNQLFVYNLLKDNENIDFQFLMFSESMGHYNPKNIKKFLELYSTSAVVIIDDYFRLLNMFSKRDGVKLFQLWHACGAFKTFGFSRIGKEGGPRQHYSNHRMYDYAIVSSANIAKHYAEGFGLSDESVIATGIPRTDIFFSVSYSNNVKEKLYSKYPSLKNKKVLLFAPTFRGNGQVSAYFPLDKLDIQKLYEDLSGEYTIIVKLHPFCKERYTIHSKYSDSIIDLSDDDELNDLLFITDLLITDYSSVVFEASLLKIPMLFYSYDLAEYVSQRDFYYEYEYFVPGKIVYNQEELTQSILHKDFDYDKVEAFRTKFFDNIDGKSSQRVADKIINVLRGEI